MDPVFHPTGLGVFFQCVKWITWLQVSSEYVVFRFLAICVVLPLLLLLLLFHYSSTCS